MLLETRMGRGWVLGERACKLQYPERGRRGSTDEEGGQMLLIKNQKLEMWRRGVVRNKGGLGQKENGESQRERDRERGSRHLTDYTIETKKNLEEGPKQIRLLGVASTGQGSPPRLLFPPGHNYSHGPSSGERV